MPDDDIREGEPDRPRKKKARPPDEDDDRPRRRRRDADDEDDDLGGSPLSAIVPVGGSIWAVLSLYVALFSCFIPGLGLLSLLFGILAFVTHKHKASYGSITGNIRAVLGILISLGTLVLWIGILVIYLMDLRAFR